MSGRDEAGIIGTVHKEQVVCAIRTRFGSLAAFERAHDLPKKSVSEELRKRCSRRVREAIEAFLREEAAARAAGTPLGRPTFDEAEYAERWAIFRNRIMAIAAEERPKSEASEARATLIFRRRAELLLQLIDQRAQRQRVIHAPFSFRRLAHALGNLKNIFSRASRPAFQQPQHGNLELRSEEDVDLQLALMICEHRDALIDRHFHFDSPAGGDSHRVTEAAGASSSGRGGAA